MAATVVNSLDKVATFYDSSLGKKAVMAASGAILFGFVVAHMLGNLQVFLGKDVMNAYAEMLHRNMGLLWGARIVLLVSVGLHIWSAIQLTALKKEARPVGYVKPGNVQGSLASRSMTVTGLMVAFFVVGHLLHLTTGTIHPNFVELNAYDNLVNGFRVVPAAIAYIMGMILLGAHLSHGISSMFQTIGFHHPKYTPMIRTGAAVVAWATVAGFVSIPVAILLGIVR